MLVRIDLATFADAMHLTQHAIILLHIRFERLLVEATASSPSADPPASVGLAGDAWLSPKFNAVLVRNF
jgi:hypothetical protein